MARDGIEPPTQGFSVPFRETTQDIDNIEDNESHEMSDTQMICKNDQKPLKKDSNKE